MGLKERIIKMLEKEVEPSAGRIDLETLDEATRERMFQQFGEGDKNLTEFLKVAYNHGAPSQFCCSGHGSRSAYVNLKVTDENIEMLRALGKVLSNYNVVTNFTNDHIRGVYMDLRGINNNLSTAWLHVASQVLEKPELYNSSNPSKYYHEEIYDSHKPFGFDLKKKLLNYLRGNQKQLIETTESSQEGSSSWWTLNDEAKENIKPIDSDEISKGIKDETVTEYEEQK